MPGVCLLQAVAELRHLAQSMGVPDPAGDPWNYLLPTSPVPNSTFATDNEGGKLWAKIGSAVDSVNVMAYDAGTDAGPLQARAQLGAQFGAIL